MSDITQSPQKTSSYFVRKSPQTPSSTTSPTSKPTTLLNIPGTRTSLQNNQLLTPIGIPSIDSFIGGGLPVGGVCLIGQDQLNFYTDIISRCFIAEGVTYKHSIFVADLTEDKHHLFQRIPAVNKLDESATESKVSDELRIAWRYGQQKSPETPQQNESKQLLQPNYYLTNKLMNSEDIFNASNVGSFEPRLANDNENQNDEHSLYSQLASQIEAQIEKLNLNVNKTKQYTNILRIVIQSAGSLIWNDRCTIDESESIHLCKFLLYVRQLLRHSLAVCVVTVPNEVASNVDLMSRLTHLSDYAFFIDDSTTSVSRLTNTEYNGLFRLLKLPRLNSLTACFTPETHDLAFYLKKKRLVVEQLHLPPDISESDDTQKGRTNTSVSISCSSSNSSLGSNKLDF